MKYDYNWPHTLSSFSDRMLTRCVLILLGLSYVLVGLYSLGQHPNFGETDTSFYFDYALKVKETGGFFGFVGSLFTGSFTLSNQHPIYPYIISTFQQNSIDWFIHIKLLNFFLGLLFIYIFYYLIKSLSNEIYGMLAACLLIANDTFMHQTTMVSCETLLIIFSGLSFYFLIKGLDDNRYWIAAGFFAGLTYMTKASGMFIIFGFGLFLLWDRRFRFRELLKNKYLWFFLLMFVVVSLPLLVRNTIVYKFPFYNYNVQIIAMEEDWGRAERMGQFSDILKKDPGENALRFLHGLAREFRLLLHSLYSFSIHYVPKFTADVSLWFSKGFAALVSAVLFVFSLIGFYKAKIERRKKLLLVFLFIGFYLPLSWYSINAPNRRYLLPVTILFPAFAAVFLADSMKIIFTKMKIIFGNPEAGNQERNIKSAILLFLILFCGIYPFSRSIPNPMKTYTFEDGYHELAHFLIGNLGMNEKYLKKGEHNYAFNLLYPELEKKRDGTKYFKTFERYQEFLKLRKDIKYVLMDAEVYRMTKNILSPYISEDRGKGFVLLKEIPGLKLIKQDTNPPVDYMLFQRTD